LPGAYYLQVAEQLFQDNELATGRFVALGRRIDLADVDVPILMLAARDDELVAAPQMFAAENLVATPPSQIEKLVAPSNHLGLFMGARTLAEIWPRVSRWMSGDAIRRALRRGRMPGAAAPARGRSRGPPRSASAGPSAPGRASDRAPGRSSHREVRSRRDACWDR